MAVSDFLGICFTTKNCSCLKKEGKKRKKKFVGPLKSDDNTSPTFCALVLVQPFAVVSTFWCGFLEISRLFWSIGFIVAYAKIQNLGLRFSYLWVWLVFRNFHSDVVRFVFRPSAIWLVLRTVLIYVVVFLSWAFLACGLGQKVLHRD